MSCLRFVCCLTVLSLVCPAVAAGDYPFNPCCPFGSGTSLALEYVAAVGLGALAAVAGGCAGMAIDKSFEGRTGPAFTIGGAFAFNALGAATGAWLVGSKIYHENGKFSGALAGSVLGTVIGIPLAVSTSLAQGNDPTTGFIIGLALPALGAVIGYDLTGQTWRGYYRQGFRVGLPALALGVQRMPDRRTSPVLRARLLNVEF